ncbi:Crp/Fnr family transcriptional regulator [Sphingomonas rubra]|uniref:cAMP-binding domain of CRP or a regulatory subunit of cAMP-dependent protein kinases n=1 Tax=Sphingomonas rubra TaxID=634430 RepID=A0A1I5SDF3_9SPHN|nr:Crp/Fnr family transcriptional regulator [Sphingomonas rubra]SFP68774.1 cAMP-binding domain of CRP or a regulatory subunit of cAMP-dependent protein kinases [Sphingomonas rubra]
MLECRLTDRLGDYIDLTSDERTAVDRLTERELRLRRGATLLRENDRPGELYVLTRGTMMSYVLLDDGSRQIVRFLLPGDLVGMAGVIYQQSPETITASTDCTVAPFDRALLGILVDKHPRLGALLLALAQMERVVCTDRLAAIGRTTAKARVAALLLEVRDRLRQLDASIVDTFAPGITQEEIGDATGLTAVHVNRMLRQLEDDGLIAREGGRITLLDGPTLARISSYVNRYAGFDLGWLPPAR